MGRTYRQIAAAAVGMLIASPALALLTGSVAQADSGDLASIGPVTVDGYTEALAYNTATGAFDNYLVGSDDGYPYDLDVYVDPSGLGDSEVLLTVPLLFQGGFTDVDGTITPISSLLDPADFVNSDIGLIDLGGTPAPAAGVISLGPFDVGGYQDTFSINSANFAIDNYATGLANGLPFDVDFFTGTPGSDTSELLLTVPALFQVGLDDVDGAITPIYSLGTVLDPDLGLGAIAGV